MSRYSDPPGKLYDKVLFEADIRLVEVQAGNWHDAIRCTLLSASFSSDPKPEYEALSYVWGSRKSEQQLYLTDRESRYVQITHNLDCALRRLRRSDGDRCLWIDALCINQANDLERAQQVSLMGRIYASAKSVIVYLGEIERLSFTISPPRLYEAMSMTSGDGIFQHNTFDEIKVKEFKARCDEIQAKKRVKRRSDEDLAVDVYCLISLLSQDTNTSRIDASTAPFVCSSSKYLRQAFEYLRQLLRAKWWQRVWVIQEAVLPENLLVMYGPCIAPWSMFVQAASAFRGKGTSSPDQQQFAPEYVKIVSHFSSTVLDLENLRQKWLSGETSTTLSLLRQFSGRAASDDRDKIYALLGLAKDGSLFTPNYSLSVSKTFESTTLRMVEISRSLDVLIGNVGRKNRKDLPSWVPDWSTSFDTTNAIWSTSTGIYDASRGLCVCLLDAESTQPWNKTWTKYLRRMPWTEYLLRNKFVPIERWYDGVLQLPGYNFGTVKHLGEPCLSSDACFLTVRAWSLLFKDFSINAPSQMLISFLRSICAGVFYPQTGNDGAEDAHRRITESDIEKLVTWWTAEGNPTIDAIKIEVEMAIRNTIVRRRFFITDTGMMGLAPLETCEGDLLYLLPGGNTPFVLRGGVVVEKHALPTKYVITDAVTEGSMIVEIKQTKSRRMYCHQLIGDCYADGIMDGETISDWLSDATTPLHTLSIPTSSDLLTEQDLANFNDSQDPQDPMDENDLFSALKDLGFEGDFESFHQDVAQLKSTGLVELEQKLSQTRLMYGSHNLKESARKKLEVDAAIIELEIMSVKSELVKRRREYGKKCLRLDDTCAPLKRRAVWDRWAERWNGKGWIERDQTNDIFLV